MTYWPVGLVTCWNNKSISESKRVPFLLNGKHMAVSRIQLRLIGLLSRLIQANRFHGLLGEIKEGVYWRSTLEIVITINWRALPPTGSLNNFVHHSDSYLSKSFFFVFFYSLCSCFRKCNDQRWIVIVIPLRIILIKVNHLMFRKQHARMQCQPSSEQINQIIRVKNFSIA